MWARITSATVNLSPTRSFRSASSASRTGVELQEGGAVLLAFPEVHHVRLEGDLELLEHPSTSRRPRRTELVELHRRSPVSFETRCVARRAYRGKSTTAARGKLVMKDTRRDRRDGDEVQHGSTRRWRRSGMRSRPSGATTTISNASWSASKGCRATRPAAPRRLLPRSGPRRVCQRPWLSVSM